MMKKKCPLCEDQMVWADDIVSEIDGYTFIEKGYRCLSCGEEFIPEAEGDKMIKMARKMDLWGKPSKVIKKNIPKSKRQLHTHI